MIDFSKCDVIAVPTWGNTFRLHIVLNSYKPTPRHKVRHDCLVVSTGSHNWNGNWEVETCRSDRDIINAWVVKQGGVLRGRLTQLVVIGSVSMMVSDLVRSEKFQKSLKRRIKYTIERCAMLTSLFEERQAEHPYTHPEAMKKWHATKRASMLRRLGVFESLVQ